MSPVFILTGDAAESLEVMYPYQRLLEEGYDVHIAGPSKKLQFVVHDFVDGVGVVNGVMVSASAWPDHPSWMREFLRILRERAPTEGTERTQPAGVA